MKQWGMRPLLLQVGAENLMPDLRDWVVQDLMEREDLNGRSVFSGQSGKMVEEDFIQHLLPQHKSLEMKKFLQKYIRQCYETTILANM